LSRVGVRVPRPVLSFLLKGLVFFVIWKVLYLALLLPARVPDRALTRLVGFSTVDVLNVFSSGTAFMAVEVRDDYVEDGIVRPGTSVDIRRGGMQTLRVADACNGLELMVLYVGFFFCFPGPLRRKLVFAVGGCVLITVVNILRCAVLVQIFIKYRAYLDFSHHFAFTFIIYALIFLLWFLFTKKLSPNGGKAGA
jgi:exosortase family protein XrtF